jgi:hypothetical protein
MRRTLIAWLTIGSWTLVGCGPKTDATSDSVTASASTDQQADAGGENGTFLADVTYSDGKNTATYKSEAKGDPCHLGNHGLSGMYLASSEAQDTDKVLNVSFETRSKPPGSTDDFMFDAGISNPAFGGDQHIDPKKGRGTGTLTVSGSAAAYTITLKGKTEKGIGVDATFHCLDVWR